MDLIIQFSEEMVGAGHPTKPDTLNRAFLAEHDSAGKHAYQIPSGAKMWFYQNVAPTGWSLVTSTTDCLIAVKGGTNAYAVTGGTMAGVWTEPPHSHETYGHRHTSGSLSGTTEGPYGGAYSVSLKDVSMPNMSHVHTVHVNNGQTDWAGAGYTGYNAVPSTHRPLAAVGIICQKD